MLEILPTMLDAFLWIPTMPQITGKVSASQVSAGINSGDLHFTLNAFVFFAHKKLIQS